MLPVVDPLHSLTFGDLVREHRRSWPLKTAVVCGAYRATFPELDARVSRLANALGAAGVREGDRVLWLGQNCHRVLEALLACAKAGAVFCPANWRQTAEEMSFVIGDCGPAVVLWQEAEIGERVREARERTGSGALWLRHDDGEYEAFLASASPVDPDAAIDAAAPVLQMYTAAFEGRPNGALLTHAGLLAQDLVLALVNQLSHTDVYLACGPLFHIWTFINMTAVFHVGGTIVFTPRVDAPELCRLISEERATRAFIMPPTMAEIVEVNRDGRYGLKSLKAMPGPPEWNAMTSPDPSLWGRRPGGYGQTEVGGLLTFSAIGDDASGPHGRVSPIAHVRILDEDGNEVPPGEAGEICVRGPAVMLGYHDRPELNAARQRGGWHRTNDLGRREPDGSIAFIGPKTTLIKSAAENIYPAEVEGCIRQHPAVADVCVIGVPDQVWAQSVKAVVVLKGGETATADEIVAHCRARIASYKKPRYVEFVESLPRTAAGTVDRAAVDAAHGGGGYPGTG